MFHSTDPSLGALTAPSVGTFLYDAFIFTGSESILNRPNATARAHHERARNAERQKPIAGVGPDMC